MGAGVATITLDRPDALNAFDRTLKDEFLAALKRAARDRDVRVVVVTGEGRAFSAGQDLREGLPGAAGTEEAVARDTAAAVTPLDEELRARYNPIVMAIRSMDKPVIAAVNGVAAGAGMSLALACDTPIPSEGAALIGVFPPLRLIPPPPPARALATRAAPAAQLTAETRALAVRLASAAPLALALAKRAVNRALEVGLSEALDYEASLQGIAGRSADYAEGVRAFVEKRPSRFTGEERPRGPR